MHSGIAGDGGIAEWELAGGGHPHCKFEYRAPNGMDQCLMYDFRQSERHGFDP